MLRPSRVTNNPKLVTPLIVPSKSSPTLSCMKWHLSQLVTSRAASSARRSVIEVWTPSCCHVIPEGGYKVGEDFDGTISGVTSFGLFVTLDGLNIDGLVHITELGRDYFHFDAGRHALIGERSGRTFQLAERLRVKVARVDLEQSKIDFTLAEDVASAPTPERRPVFVEPLSRDSRPLKGKARR